MMHHIRTSLFEKDGRIIGRIYYFYSLPDGVTAGADWYLERDFTPQGRGFANVLIAGVAAQLAYCPDLAAARDTLQKPENGWTLKF